MFVYIEIYYNESAHMIMEASKTKIHRVGQQAGDPEEMMMQFQFKGSLLENSFPFGSHVFMFYCFYSVDWLRPINYLHTRSSLI